VEEDKVGETEEVAKVEVTVETSEPTAVSQSESDKTSDAPAAEETH
jgi:hypothetical protein